MQLADCTNISTYLCVVLYLLSYVSCAILCTVEEKDLFFNLHRKIEGGVTLPISFEKLSMVMEQRGVKKYDLRKNGVNSQILDKVLSNGNVNTRTIAKLCHLLQCQPGDIMEYTEDQP